MEYPALIDGEAGAYGVVFPDLPGCVAMGSTVDEALRHAEEALRDWMDSMEEAQQYVQGPSPTEDIDLPPDCTLVSVALVKDSPDKQAVSPAS